MELEWKGPLQRCRLYQKYAILSYALTDKNCSFFCRESSYERGGLNVKTRRMGTLGPGMMSLITKNVSVSLRKPCRIGE